VNLAALCLEVVGSVILFALALLALAVAVERALRQVVTVRQVVALVRQRDRLRYRIEKARLRGAVPVPVDQLRELALAPTLERATQWALPGLRCRQCHHQWTKAEGEHHDARCAYVVARDALAAASRDQPKENE